MDGVAVPIQLQEGNGMLVPSMQASQLARDRGDVKTTATIEFKCTQEDIDRAMRAKERIKLTHAIVDGVRHTCTNMWTSDVDGCEVVRAWMVTFPKPKRRLDGTEIKLWRRNCFVPEPLKEAFALKGLENLKAVAGLYVVQSPLTRLLLPGRHMFLCDVVTHDGQVRCSHGGLSKVAAWDLTVDQVIANGATGLIRMESSPLFVWLPKKYKDYAKDALEHKCIGWEEGQEERFRLVLTQR